MNESSWKLMNESSWELINESSWKLMNESSWKLMNESSWKLYSYTRDSLSVINGLYIQLLYSKQKNSRLFTHPVL